MIILEVILHQNEGDTGRFDTKSSSEIAQQLKLLVVIAWTRKTYDVSSPRSISQLRETIYTSTQLTCIETTGNHESASEPGAVINNWSFCC